MTQRSMVVPSGLAAGIALAALIVGCSRAVERQEEPLPSPPPEQRRAVPEQVPPLPSPPPPPRVLAEGEADGAELGVPGGVAGGVTGGVPGGVAGSAPGRVLGDSVAAMEVPMAAATPPMAFAQQLQKQSAPDMNPPARYVGPMNTEAYDRIRDNPFLAVATNPLSTFSIDVDTASYANVRRFLESGQLPPKDAVRIEELVNYFRYDYPQPKGSDPFSVNTEVFDCPWAPDHRLVSIGLQGRRIDDAAVPPRNLVFLLDVSGSMLAPRKLPLLQSAMKLLVDQLRPEDRVSIVVYAGSSGLVLPPTSGARRAELREAIDRLQAGGSTAGGAGIELAYQVAAETFVEDGINRVILATDGDFNVGVTNQGDLVRLIESKRETGVFLSVLGFGEGNLKDSTMEKLADSGNGNYAYIDSLSEARKVLVHEAGATLVTIAKDVKLQIEFNPERVAAFRLIGYENRMLRAEDFKDDRKDAGEIGAGHSVTALYEVVPAGVAIDLPDVDPLKYQRPAVGAGDPASDELLSVKLRYKDPDGDTSRPLSVAVRDDHPGERASADARFASAVAGFGMLLRNSEHKGTLTWNQVSDLARGALGSDREGYRAQFCQLVEAAEALSSPTQISAIR